MKKTCLFFVLLCFSHWCRTQETYPEKIYRSQLELRHDNDFFTLTDRYYSSGLFVTYRTSLKKGVFGGNEQLSFRLGQEVYTPAQTQSFNSNVFDRPYVGYTGLLTTWSKAQDHSLFQTGVSIGIAGNNSGAGGFQRWYHKAIAISDSPLWIDELHNSFHLNSYISYIKEWELAPNPFGIRLALKPEIALGSRDVYADSETIIHFGRRNSIKESIAYSRLGNNSREIYFSLRFAYRQVLYNGLIEGNLFGDNSPVLRESENSLLRFGFDFNHRFDQNDYKVGIRYTSPETAESESHIYIQLSYALSF